MPSKCQINTQKVYGRTEYFAYTKIHATVKVIYLLVSHVIFIWFEIFSACFMICDLAIVGFVTYKILTAVAHLCQFSNGASCIGLARALNFNRS